MLSSCRFKSGCLMIRHKHMVAIMGHRPPTVINKPRACPGHMLRLAGTFYPFAVVVRTSAGLDDVGLTASVELTWKQIPWTGRASSA